MANEWPTATIGDVCLRVTKGTTPTTGGGAFSNHGIAFIKVEAITESGGFLAEKFAFIDPETDERLARSRLKEHDILFTIAGTIGRVALVTRDVLPANTNQAVAIVRPNRAVIHPKFLYYVLRDDKRIQLAQSKVVQSVQANFSLGELSAIELPLPSQAEQRAIAHILGALDDKIELNRRRNQTLEAMARALFKDWFVDFGPVRAKMEGPDGQDGLVSGQRHGRRASGPTEPYLPAELWQLFPDRLDDEGKPEGWNYRPVGEFAEFKGGKQLEKERISPTGQVPVFGGAGIMGYTDSHNADGFVIAVGRVGAYCGQFFAHRGKAWINNNASLIRQTDNTFAEWLFLALRHADIDVIKKGAAQPFVSNGDIAKLPLVWPGDNLARVFTDVVSPMQKKKDQHDAESSSLAQLRDTLLPKLISGELRIADAERVMETCQ